MTLGPRSLAGRTLLVLWIGLAIVQGGGLLIHALDRVQLQRLSQARDLGQTVVGAYATVVGAPREQWPAVVGELDLGPDIRASLGTESPRNARPPAPIEVQNAIRPFFRFGPIAPALRPRDTPIRGDLPALLIGFRLPDDRWLVFDVRDRPPRPWASPNFLTAFGAMTAAAAALAIWAVRRLLAPVRALAAAAERLGRDVNAPPLPERGPTEVASAAGAFNTMAARVRQLVDDRTFLLTAIGHDLRTPLTRLRLRAEFMTDPEQRRRMLADLDALGHLVDEALAFGRDVSAHEPAVPVDVAVLMRTVLDEAGDLHPDRAPDLTYDGPDHLVVPARAAALKRAAANLVDNALAYGGNAHVAVAPPRAGMVAIRIEDDGPGVPPDAIERLMEPFQRLDDSRSRETGGTGLGLPIARAILRAHGGDVALANRPQGGLAATMTVPALHFVA